MFGAFAPARTPAPLIKRLNADIARVLSTKDVRDKLLKGGVEAASSSPERLAKMMNAEMQRMSAITRKSGASQ